MTVTPGGPVVPRNAAPDKSSWDRLFLYTKYFFKFSSVAFSLLTRHVEDKGRSMEGTKRKRKALRGTGM